MPPPKNLYNLQDGIENYEKSQLKPAETMEKNTLPTKEIIELEKSQ